MFNYELAEGLPDAVPTTLFRNLIKLIVRNVELVFYVCVVRPYTFLWSGV